MRRIITAAVIQNKNLLVVRKNQTWIIPGGKPNQEESDLECLAREIQEELSGTEIENIRYYGMFTGKAPHTKDIVESFVYLADIKGELKSPSAEISGAKFIRDYRQDNVSEVVEKVFESLKERGYL